MIRWIFADAFLNTLTNYRVLSLTGRVGGGKTSLAVILAGWLASNGYIETVVSDINIEGSTFPAPVPLKNTAIILDETWRLIKTGGDVQNYAAYMRKLNNYLLMPSNMDVPAKIQFFQTWRVFNFYVLAIPIWMYAWRVTSKSIAEKGFFYVQNPHEVFGVYNTMEMQRGDGGIMQALNQTVEIEYEKFERKVTTPILKPDFEQLQRREDLPAGLEADRIARKSKATQTAKVLEKVVDRLDTVVGEMGDAANASRESAEQIRESVRKIKR